MPTPMPEAPDKFRAFKHGSGCRFGGAGSIESFRAQEPLGSPSACPSHVTSKRFVPKPRGPLSRLRTGSVSFAWPAPRGLLLACVCLILVAFWLGSFFGWRGGPVCCSCFLLRSFLGGGGPCSAVVVFLVLLAARKQRVLLACQASSGATQLPGHELGQTAPMGVERFVCWVWFCHKAHLFPGISG